MVIISLAAYNEEQTLPRLLETIREAMQENAIDYRVIVVNDGSTDATANAVEKEMGRMPVSLVTHRTNLGLGEATRTGLMSALESADSRDIIVTMDADNTHSPALIARMVRGIREGNDVVIASRFRPAARIKGVPLYRRFLSRGGSWMLRTIFPTHNVRDFTSGYRAYRAAILEQAFATYGRPFVAESGFACMLDILLKLRRLDAIMCEVPLILRYDFKYGLSKMMVLRTLSQTLRLIAVRRLGLR